MPHVQTAIPGTRTTKKSGAFLFQTHGFIDSSLFIPPADQYFESSKHHQRKRLIHKGSSVFLFGIKKTTGSAGGSKSLSYE